MKKNSGQFKKGQTSRFKGKKHRPESLKKLRESLKGRKAWNKGKKENRKDVLERQSKSHFGLKQSEETKKKRRGKTPWNKGKKNPSSTGPNNNNWKGGITPINEKIRKSPEYKLWRLAVFERDKYTCIWCGKKGGTLNADHIKPFCDYPELRFAIDNGRTLCLSCHKKTDTYGCNNRDKKGRYTSVGRAGAGGFFPG